MAYMKSAAIITRLREVITEGYGTLRTIAAGTYSDDDPEGLDPEEERRRALVVPVVRVHVRQGARSKASPPVYGNLLIYEMAVDVTCTRVVTTAEQLDDASRETLEASSLSDQDVLRQALECPGNLTTTAAGTATDIASGMLTHVSSSWAVEGQVNAGAQSFVGTHRFSGHFFSRPATS